MLQDSNNKNNLSTSKKEIFNQNRRFLGIWIPASIWNRKDLLPTEKILWAEIQSLSNEDGICFASNQYLAEFLGISERYIRKILEKLKRLELVSFEGFDGKIRYLRALEPKIEPVKKLFEGRNCSSGLENSGWNCSSGLKQEKEKEKNQKKKKKNIIYKKETRSDELSDYFLKKFNEYRKSIGLKDYEPMSFNNWEKALLQLLKKNDFEKLKMMIDFIFSDSFWQKTIQSPHGILKNIVRIETLIATRSLSVEKEKEVIKKNLEWLKEYQNFRARISAVGILKFDFENAWDEKTKYRWKLSDSELKNKIISFYKNYK